MSAQSEIKALIADDEPAARAALSRILHALPGVTIVAECSSGEEALAHMQSSQIDVAFLDISMPGLSGLDVVDRIEPENSPIVVFVTAHDDRAVEAFEREAQDYLLKPMDPERVSRSVERVRRAVRLQRLEAIGEEIAMVVSPESGRATETSSEKRPAGGRIGLKMGERTVFVEFATIDWVESAASYVRVHCGDQTHVVRETMTAMEQRLEPEMFVRIHRSTIVNVKRVRELQPYFHGDSVVVLHDGTQLRVSRTRRRALEKSLGESA